MQTKETNPKDAIAGDKLPTNIIPDTVTVALAAAMFEGMCKYGAHNYRTCGARASVYISALDRHMLSWRNGEEIDPDSGLPHLWKALACLAILIDTKECKVLVDDRPPKAPVGEMIRSLEIFVKEIKEKHKDKKPHHYTIVDSKDDDEGKAEEDPDYEQLLRTVRGNCASCRGLGVVSMLGAMRGTDNTLVCKDCIGTGLAMTECRTLACHNIAEHMSGYCSFCRPDAAP